jgi:integrase
LFKQEKLKIIFQQNRIVLTRKVHFHRKINNALTRNTRYCRYFQTNQSFSAGEAQFHINSRNVINFGLFISSYFPNRNTSAINRPIFLWLKHHYRRPAEACALQWRDWDDINKVFNIRRSISARQIVPSTKTGAIHCQPYDPDFLPIIKRLRHDHLDKGGNPDEYIFQNPRARRKGKRYTNESLNVLWRAACKKEGISISLHEGLKHSSCSQFVNEKEGTVDELQTLTDHVRRDSVLKYAKVGVGRKLALMKKWKLKIVTTADPPQKSK